MNRNYSVVCASSMQTRFEGTLKECFEEVRHAAPFLIVNNTTNLTVLVRAWSGFRPAKRFFNLFPERSERLESSRKFFTL